MKTLLHCCCGPCAYGAIEAYAKRGKGITTYFYNPNIQPFKEHESRLKSFVELMRLRQIDYIVNDAYPLESWLFEVAADPSNRCVYCYRSRLASTAETAAARGFESFSTTLLISPYQNHRLIQKIGEEAASKYQVAFDYIDLRPYFRGGQNEARAAGLYMQKYCGCIYSEKERYQKPKKEK